MTEEGWHVTCVCSPGSNEDFIRRHVFDYQPIKISRSLNPFKALITLVRLFLFFRQSSFDVLHVHTPVAAFLGRIAGKIAGIPTVIYTAHGFFFHDDMPFLKRHFFVLLERFAGFFTDLLFCQSSEDAASAVRLSILPASRVFFIGNGVDINKFTPDPYLLSESSRLKESLGIPNRAFVFGFIGRHVCEKGLCELLHAASLIAPSFPNFYLILVGERLSSDHSSAVDVDILKAKNVLGDKLIVLGPRSDIPMLLSVMDVFCLPSWREGMPRSIIEAMMMSKPVIATDIRGCREEVINGETGLLVPVKSAGQIAKALLYFLHNPSKAKLFGQNGRARALAEFDEDTVLKLQIDLIARCISS